MLLIPSRQAVRRSAIVLASLMRVDAAGRSWFANCAWDAFGIGVVLGGDTVIHTECPDCAEPIELAVRDRQPDDTSLVFHVLVPAAEWWADIGYT
jgi:hypothetical protein